MQNQYDDDLTLGSEEYDDSYYTGAEDLFEISMDEESPISRLKSLILSIDWEITDEVLLSFNDELESLKKIWAGEKINLVYVQALEKISNYIYAKKADAHLGAIKLLLTLYHNLEKIVTNRDWSDRERKALLLEDVRRFELLKQHIAKGSRKRQDQMENLDSSSSAVGTAEDSVAGNSELANLQAAVLGLDWEVTDQELDKLQREVTVLAQRYSENKPCIILLKGVRTLGLYIQQTKSNASGEAFKVLRLFSDSLEKLLSCDWTPEEEKEILVAAVEKFNDFKVLLKADPQEISKGPVPEEQPAKPVASVAAKADSSAAEGGGAWESRESTVARNIAPAFSDMAENEVQGFQAEEVAADLGLEDSCNVDDCVAGLFPDEADAGDESGFSPVFNTPREIALQGVDVETEADDDSCEERLPEVDGVLAPALSDEFEEEGSGAGAVVSEDDAGIEEAVSSFFGGIETDNSENSQNIPEPVAALSGVKEPVEDSVAVFAEGDELDTEIAPALQGVDVETEADDGEEAPLALDGDELAPALSGFTDEAGNENFDSAAVEGEGEISARLDGFFGEDAGGRIADIAGDGVGVSEVEAGENLIVGPGIAETATNADDALDEVMGGEVDCTPVLSDDIAGFEDDGSVEDGFDCKDEMDSGSTPEFTDVRAETDSGLTIEETVGGDKSGFESSEMIDSALTSALAGIESETTSSGFYPEIGDEENTGLDLAPALSDAELTEEDPGGEFAGADSEREDFVNLEDRLDDYFGADDEPAVSPAADTSPTDAFVSEPAADVEEFVVFEPVVYDVAAEVEIVQNIRQYVDELAAGGDEMLLQELLCERDSLREIWSDRPLESTFLLLFSRVSDFVEKYHGDAVLSALVLLQELGESLARLASLDEDEKQYTLFEDVRKVLAWQEGLVVI